MMKIKTAIMLIMGLFFSVPLSAEYSRLNQNIEQYSPPEYYTNALDRKSEKKMSTEDVESFSDSIFSEIKNLKQTYEAQIDKQKIAFLSEKDPSFFAGIANISFDEKAVEQIVSDRVKLNEIEIISGLRNPAVLAAKNKIRAELESFTQVMDLDATLQQYSAFTEGVNNKAGPLKMKESIKQKYPYPGLTSLKGRIIQQQVQVLIETMQAVQNDIITQVRKAYWDMVYIERSIAIASETIDAFDRLKDVATVLYKSGKTSFQDVIKINIKIEILKEDLVTFSSEKENIKIKLRELLNLSSGAKFGQVIISPAWKNIRELEYLYQAARQNRQELKMIRHQISKVENMIEMAESMTLEPFTLGFSFFEDEAVNSIGTGADKPSFSEKTMASMKNNAPAKPWYGVENPWLNQTRQNLLSLKQTLVQQENATDRMVRESWFMIDKNMRELDLYKNKILSLSKSAVDVSSREYESGSIPFSQAIGSYTDWLKVKLTIEKKRADLGISTANLEKIMGKSF